MSGKKSYSELFGAEGGQQEHGSEKESDAPIEFRRKRSNGNESEAGPAVMQPQLFIPGYKEEGGKERKILTIRDLLYIFFKHLKSITTITLVCLMTAAVYSLTVTPLYRAEAKILVKLGREKLSDLNEYSRNINILYQKRNQDVNNELEVFKGDALSKMVAEDLQAYFQDQEHDSQSDNRMRSWLNGILSRISGSPESRENQIIMQLKNALRVEFLAETDILKLSFNSPDPDFAAIAANAYADAFVRLRTKIYETTKSHQFYIEQINMYKAKVEELVEQEKQFSKKWQISQVEREKELILQNREELDREFLRAQQDYKRVMALLIELEQMKKNPESWIETPKMSENEMVDRQAYLQDIDRQYFTLKLDRSRLSKHFTEQSREIQQIDATVAKLREQKYHSLVNILNMNRVTTKGVVDGLAVEIAKKDRRLDELIQATFTLEQLHINKEVAMDTLINYQKKAENLRIYEDLDKNKITSLKTISTATAPLTPFFPKKGLILITATFFGIFISFGLSAVKEFFTHVFRDGDDVENVLDIPLLMSISYRE